MNRATVLLMAILMLIGVVAGSTVAYLLDNRTGGKHFRVRKGFLRDNGELR